MACNTVNKTEEEEHAYLEQIKNKLQNVITETDRAVSGHAKEVQETKNYLWENKSGMDHVEKVAVRQSVTQIALTGENALAKRKRLIKLKQSPYFGRIDFTEQSETKALPLYIGIHSFYDNDENENLIHDWRAPISTMFYDFELGDVYYEAPSGRIDGEISRKRQYRIRNGKMEFMLESALNIHDDVLQKELSQTSNEKMKNIVATIQRDQNAIIRNEHARVLIIQGVAGSGKTSIALHRIAFLLYRFKTTLKSEDILILSPNRVFADYISNVLPELGEEKISEIGMENLANEILDNKIKFQTFYEQVSELLDKKDEAYQERIKFKSGSAIISKLDEYFVHIENSCFTPVDFAIRRNPVPASYLAERYKAYFRLPLLKRIPEVVKDVAADIYFYNRYEVTTAERREIRREVEKMFKTVKLRQLYKDFYQWLGQPELLKPVKRAVYEYADVFPLIYLKIKLEGVKAHEKVKHLVIDEMQDYTGIQYRVLAKIFPCNKTILGDSNQAVNPFSSSNVEEIGTLFENSETVIMSKSYRSTYEIANFAQSIRHNPDLQLVERHGESPTLIQIKTEEEEHAAISALVDEYIESDYKSMGIICKTQQQADQLYEVIKEKQERIFLLNAFSSSFSDGIIIATAHMSKGLEFDQVIIPHCTIENYNTETDRQMLYVAATRAMHKLSLTHIGEKSRFF